MSEYQKEANKMWDHAKDCEKSNLNPRQKKREMDKIHSEFQRNNREPIKTEREIIKEKLDRKIRY